MSSVSTPNGSLLATSITSRRYGADPVPAIRAPWSDDAELIDKVAALRAAGEIVIQVLPGHEHEQQEFACDRELVVEAGRWTVRHLDRA